MPGRMFDLISEDEKLLETMGLRPSVPPSQMGSVLGQLIPGSSVFLDLPLHAVVHGPAQASQTLRTSLPTLDLTQNLHLNECGAYTHFVSSPVQRVIVPLQITFTTNCLYDVLSSLLPELATSPALTAAS